MKAPLLMAVSLLAVALATSQAGAQDAGDGMRLPLFSCATDAAGSRLAITGLVNPDRSVDGLLFTAPDGTVWPDEATRDPEFYLSASEGAEGYLLEIAFGDPGRYFRLFSLTPKSGEGLAGLVETGAEGERNLLFTCRGRPTIFQGELSRATRCDQATPFGSAGCNILAPAERQAPLALPLAQ